MKPNNCTFDGDDIGEFLTAWSNHQELRRGGAAVCELWASRQRLDALRSRVHAARRH